jgi:hypothetical protein
MPLPKYTRPPVAGRSSMLKVLICGDRDWGDPEPIRRVIKELKKEAKSAKKGELLIISGGAPGADTLARIIATEEDVHCAEVKALWMTRSRAAGPQRNLIMLGLEPDKVVAFHPNLAKSRGTAHTVRSSKKASIPVTVVEA